jgi:tripartite-type tricarboxylate transporter receptor subunit TctC
VRTLRSGFDATMQDPDFRGEITTTRLEFEPMSGAELQSLIESSTKATGEVLKRARAVRAE